MATAHPGTGKSGSLRSSRPALWLSRLWRPNQLEESFVRLFELGLALAALLGVVKMVSDLESTSSALLTTGLLVLVGMHVLVVVECLRPCGLRWPITLLAISGIVLVVAAQVGGFHDGPGIWRIDAWLGVPLAFLAIIEPVGPKLPLVALSGVGGLLTMAAAGEINGSQHLLATFFTAVQLALLLIARWFVSALFEEQLRNRTPATDRGPDDATQTRAEAVAAVRRAMHDSLLHCLQRISTLWQGSTAEQLRSMCAETSRELATVPTQDAAAGHDSLQMALADSVRDDGCRIHWHGDARGIPPLVADATCGAVREAVRNVVKHCRVPEARIHLQGGSSHLLVTVSDDGPGFDVGAVAVTRKGVQESIVGRMAGVGGAAEVMSSTEGTTLQLEWPAPAPATPPTLGTRPRSRLVWTPLPLILGSLVNVAIFPVPELATALVVWGILVALVTMSGFRVHHHGLSDVEAIALCCIGLVAFVANLSWLDPATMPAWAMWTPSLTGCFMFLALPGRSMPRAGAIAAGMVFATLGAGVAMIGWHATFVTHFGAFMAVIVHAAFTLMLAFGSAEVAKHVFVARQLAAAATLRARHAVERDGVWRDWLARARSLSSEFLDSVADGSLNPAETRTRQEAAWLEARIRDELRLWPSWTGLAERVDELRRSGWQVRLDIEAPTLSIGARLVEILDCVPAPAATGQSLRITARDGQATCTFSSPGLTPDQLAPLSAWDPSSDPDFTQIRTTRTHSKELA